MMEFHRNFFPDPTSAMMGTSKAFLSYYCHSNKNYAPYTAYVNVSDPEECDPCKLKMVPPLSPNYVKSMQMDAEVVERNHNMTRMRYENFNAHCDSRYSPSQLRYHPGVCQTSDLGR